MRSLGMGVALALVMSSTGAWAMSPKDVYKKCASAVVLVLGSDDGRAGSGGTGSFITSDGKIITNAHVVLGHDTNRPYRILYVFLKPPKITGDNAKDLANRYKAHVVAYSPPDELDLALLQIEDGPSTVPTIAFADPDRVDVGDEVVAIGHPEQGGLWTLTTGAISTVIANYNHVKGKNVFQTEASVNRGNSGGPLLDTDGNMVGINTMIARQSADGVAITSVNFSLKSSVAVSWLALQNMALAYAPRTEGDATATVVASNVPAPAAPSPTAPVPTEAAPAAPTPPPPAANAPAPNSKVSAANPPPATIVVAQAPPPKPAEIKKVAAQIAQGGATAAPVTKGKPLDPAKAKPTFVTEKKPFNIDDLRRSQMKDLENMMDEMRMKTGNQQGGDKDGMGLW